MVQAYTLQFVLAVLVVVAWRRVGTAMASMAETNRSHSETGPALPRHPRSDID